FGIPLQHICRALKIIARKHPDLGIVYPVHPNPEVRRIANQELTGLRNIALIEPLGYIDFIKLMERSCIVLTDSGGIQEEAPSLGKPVLILRDKTERPEVVQAGCAKLIGTSTQSIVSACERLLSNKQSYQSMSRKKNPVGDGKAAVRIKRFVDVYMRKIS
nr:UDP-N-acetylglucosamine 2-epimerase [Candidatus Omnitrophota bacterium]